MTSKKKFDQIFARLVKEGKIVTLMDKDGETRCFISKEARADWMKANPNMLAS